MGVGLNAEMRGYEDIYSMIDDLFEKDHLDGVMVDNFILSASTDILEKKNIHVELELNYPVTYGKHPFNRSFRFSTSKSMFRFF